MENIARGYEIMLKKCKTILKKIDFIYLYIFYIVYSGLIIYHLIKIDKFKVNLLFIGLLIYFSILVMTKKICKMKINNTLNKFLKSSWAVFIIAFILLSTVNYFTGKSSSIIYFNLAIGIITFIDKYKKIY